MKLSKILSMFMLLAVCSTGLSGNGEEDFPKEYIQPINIGIHGYWDDYNNFKKYGICEKCDLRGFDLREIIKKYAGKKINLSGSFCAQANLSNSDLSGANLSDCNFYGANFENSTLENVNAKNASFPHSYMPKVNMKNANIENTHINNANLLDANFEGAKVSEKTSFEGSNCEFTDFSNIKNLHQVNFKNAKLKNSKFDSTFTNTMRTAFAPILGWFSRK